MDRRGFLKVAAGGMASAAFSIGATGANERVVIGVMGINGRGMDLATEFARMPDVELAYLADPDSRLFKDRAKQVGDITGKKPKCVQDFRKMLDDKKVDGIAIAACDHWHALGTIMACQAGKDVYVEKPTAHNVWESRKMVEAARKYERVVQVGTQNRSAEYVAQAIEHARSSAFGDIHFLRVLNSKRREPMPAKPDSDVPKGVDYDMWLGPAPERPFNENRFHYSWHWFWDYGGGDLSNDGVHQIDIARWLTDRRLPNAVFSSGGTFGLKDGRETPDTQTVTWDFDELQIVLEETLWTPYMDKTPLELRDKGDSMPNWPFNGTRVEVYGSKQFMCLGRMGDGWQVYDADGKSLFAHRGQFAVNNTRHARNFIDCIRSRNRPNADIEEGHYSTSLSHYGNIAFRMARRLYIDPATEGFIDDPEANKLLYRDYREPWVVPKSV